MICGNGDRIRGKGKKPANVQGRAQYPETNRWDDHPNLTTSLR